MLTNTSSATDSIGNKIDHLDVLLLIYSITANTLGKNYHRQKEEHNNSRHALATDADSVIMPQVQIFVYMYVHSMILYGIFPFYN